MYQLICCSGCANGDKFHKTVCIFNNYYKLYDKLNSSQILDGFRIMNLLKLEKKCTFSKDGIVDKIKLYNIYSDADEYKSLEQLIKELDLVKYSYNNIIDIIAILVNSKKEYIDQLFSAYIVATNNYKKNMLFIN